MNLLRNLWIASIPAMIILLVLGCGEPQNESAASRQEIQASSTPTATPEPVEESVEDREPELTSEDVETQIVQTAVAYITLDEYLQTASLRHNKPLLVNFWATWCAPCIEEMPHIVELYEKYGARIDFLAVSCDSFTDTVDTVPSAMKTLKMAFTTRVLKTEDQNKAISSIDADWQGALPATFVYDVKGKKIKSYYGAQSKETFESAIQEALKTVLQVKLD